MRIKYNRYKVVFIKCNLRVKDIINHSMSVIHIFLFPRPQLIQAFSYLTLGLHLCSTKEILHLWLLWTVLSGPQII